MAFQDILNGNATYSKVHKQLDHGKARRGLAVVTCMDTRIDPNAAFGLIPGDAKVIRNAGARVTDDVLRTLIMAVNALGVDRIALIQHTQCGGTVNSQEDIVEVVQQRTGESPSEIDFLTVTDQIDALHKDAEILRNCKYLPDGTEVGEFIFDVDQGTLEQIA